MPQPGTNATSTQLKLVSNMQLTRHSLACPTVSAALIPIVVAPQLRATSLPCIASPETVSSGNTQHLGTENNRFIDASGTRFILQQVARPSGTHGAARQYVHYLVNMAGASITRNYAATEERRSGTPWHHYKKKTHP